MLSENTQTHYPYLSKRFLSILFILLLASIVLFMSYGVKGDWDFVLMLRGKKLLMLLTVAYAVGVSTLLFQTLTNNNILTPGLMGYDSLYLLLQTLMVFVLGATGYTILGTIGKFAIETPLMMVASLLLFRTLNQQSHGDLARLILVGMIFGVMFRSINSLLQRMLDPSAFTVAQIQYFAQFTSVNVKLLSIGMIIMFISAICIWRMRHRLDILMLGRPIAITLGLNYVQFSRQILLWIALLVSVSTALVGPVSFFGLLVCALVNQCAPNLHHSIRIPSTFMTAAIVLIFGQTVFEHILGMQGVLSIVIEFLGGLVFLWLVLKPQRH